MSTKTVGGLMMLRFGGILLFVHCTVTARAAVCSAGDRAALLQFKSELEDPYNEYADWNTNTDCCTWLQSNKYKVITCNSDGRVTSLTMGSPLEPRPLPVWQRVSGGKFGVSLGNLTYLQKLDLTMPYCGGAIIPSTWANLVHLSNITMDIYLGGPLPGPVVKNWPLQWLVFTNNDMNGTIPKQLCKSSLQTLNLTGNQFTGHIPSCLSRFPADSFAGGFTGSNPGLCGAPLPAKKSHWMLST